MSSSARFSTSPPASYSASIFARPARMASASAASMMPFAFSIWQCATEPRKSCFHKRLSNGIEALISRMTADSPSANRPPHSLLDVSMRLIIAALLTLALAGCDKGKQDQPQEQASIARIDRSLAGQEAPATHFLGPQDQPVTLAAIRGKQIGNASCRHRVCPSGENTGGARKTKKKTN